MIFKITHEASLFQHYSLKMVSYCFAHNRVTSLTMTTVDKAHSVTIKASFILADLPFDKQNDLFKT